MTVPAQNPSVDYIEDGVTTEFPVPFRYNSPQFIRASRIAPDGTVTTLLYGVDYSVSVGVGDTGGTLTVTAPAVAETLLAIRRFTPRVQPTDYETLGKFTAQSHEQALDRYAMIAQEQDDDIGRAPKVPEGETAPQFASLRDLQDGDLLEFRGGKLQRFVSEPFAGKFYAGDADGKPVPANGTGGGDAKLREDLANPAAGTRLSRYEGRSAYLKMHEIGISPDDFPVGGAPTMESIEEAKAQVLAREGTWLLFNRREYGTTGVLDLSAVRETVSREATIVPHHDGIGVQYVAPVGTLLARPRLSGRLRVAWDTYDWTKDRLAFYLQNIYFGHFELGWYNPTRGLRFHGTERGCVYNSIYLDECFRALVGMWFSSGSAAGWSNANRIVGGRLYGGGEVAGTLYEAEASHIYFDDSVYRSNGIVLLHQALEWVGAGFKLARMGGLRNRLTPLYAEMDTGDDTWISDTGVENSIDCNGVPYIIGYDPNAVGTARRVDASGATRPTIIGHQGYRDSGGTGSQITRVQTPLSANRPAYKGINGSNGYGVMGVSENVTGGGVAGQNTNTASAPSLLGLRPDGSVGVAIPAAGEWTVYNGTKKVRWSEAVHPVSGAVTRGDQGWYASPSSGGKAQYIVTASGIAGSTAVIKDANPIDA